MVFRSVGINLVGNYLSCEEELLGSIEDRKADGQDFLEVCPHGLDVILGVKLDCRRGLCPVT